MTADRMRRAAYVCEASAVTEIASLKGILAEPQDGYVSWALLIKAIEGRDLAHG